MDLNGTYVIGEFVGYEQQPWQSDASKVNHRIGIKTGEYDRGFGQMESDIVRLDLITPEQIEFFQGSQEKMRGKHVIVPVVVRARDGKRGAWLSQFVPKGHVARLVPAQLKAAS